MSPALQAESSIAGFPGGSDGQESAYNASACSAGDPGSIPDPLENEWLLTPIFLPGQFHGQRSLARLQTIESQRVGHD